MKKLFIILLFSIISVKSYAQADAAAIIAYMTGADAQKIANTVQMTVQMKQGVEAAIAAGKSVTSIEDMIKQIEADARATGSLEEMFAKELNDRIDDLKNEYDKIDYLDFEEVYKKNTQPFRDYSGEFSISSLATAIVTEDVGGNFYESISSHTSNAARKLAIEYNKEIDNAKVIRMQRHEEIKGLQKEARSLERQAIAINAQITLKQLQGAGQAGLALGSGMDDDKFDAADRTKEEVNRLISKANGFLDEANDKRRQVTRLLNTPIKAPEFTSEVTIAANNIQMSAYKEVQFLRTMEIKELYNGRESEYEFKKTDIVGNPFTFAKNKARTFNPRANTINEIWTFFYWIKPTLDALILLFSVWGLFNYSMALATGNDSTTKNLMIIMAGLVIWFAILPSFLPMLGAPVQ